MRVIGGKHALERRSVGDREDLDREVELCSVSDFQFLLNVVSAVFADVENHEALRLHRCDLPAKFRSDRAAATRDEDNLVAVVLARVVVDHIHFLAEKEFFNVKFAQRSSAVARVVGSGIIVNLNLAPRDLILLIERALFLGGLGGNGNDDFLDAVAHHGFFHTAFGKHGKPDQFAPDFSLVLVKKQTRQIGGLGIAQQFFRQGRADATRAHDGNFDLASLCVEFLLRIRIDLNAGNDAHNPTQKRVKLAGIGTVTVDVKIGHPHKSTTHKVQADHRKKIHEINARSVGEHSLDQVIERAAGKVCRKQSCVGLHTAVAPDLLINFEEQSCQKQAKIPDPELNPETRSVNMNPANRKNGEHRYKKHCEIV